MKSQKSPGKYLPRNSGRKLLILLSVLLCLSLALFSFLLYDTLKSQRQFREQAAQVHAYATLTSAAPETSPPSTEPPVIPETTAEIASEATVESPVETAEETVPETVPPTEPQMLPEYASLYEENPHFFGWLCIAGTRIDYPVMHSPEDPEKYLHADFSGKYSFAGTPFLDAACGSDSDNQIIYAHNMLDGSMFRSLLQYQQKDYWQRHPTISFDTPYEKREYAVLAAFYDRVYYQQENCFKFYQFIDAESEADFDTAIEYYRSKALYNTEVTAAYGDKLLTLVTCAYHTENGRFVVVAKKT